MQTVFHHVLPLAAPGILTGTIIGLGRITDSTIATHRMIGYIATNMPTGIIEGASPNSAMPAQIYEGGRDRSCFYERAAE